MKKEQNKITTTRHAVQRLCMRFYSPEKAVDASQYKMVGEYMVKALLEEHPEVAALQNGKYYVDSYGLTFVVRDGNIVTVVKQNK